MTEGRTSERKRQARVAGGKAGRRQKEGGSEHRPWRQRRETRGGGGEAAGGRCELQGGGLQVNNVTAHLLHRQDVNRNTPERSRLTFSIFFFLSFCLIASPEVQTRCVWPPDFVLGRCVLFGQAGTLNTFPPRAKTYFALRRPKVKFCSCHVQTEETRVHRSAQTGQESKQEE